MGVIILLIVLVVILILGIKIVPQQHAYVIERLGKYKKTITAGLNIIIPVIDVVRVNVNLKEQVADFPPQPVITKDNVTMQIDTVVYFKIVDPAAYAYGVENPIMAIENLTATTLRNIIGDMELDETLTSRDKVNGQLCAIIDEATDPWGIKINRVELKNIMPPKAIQESMEKQMKAERERREQIIRAEGEKQAAILEAQAQREAAIQRAQGNAEAIRQVQQAEADAVKMMNDAAPSQNTIAIKGISAFERASAGPANKLIIPSDLAGITGLATAVTEAIKTGKE